jgi:hypothetical protein
MDLNYLFLRQQVERSLADSSANKSAREAHEQLARAYELQIERKTDGRIAFQGQEGGAADEGSERLIIAHPSQSGSS